MLPRLRMTLDFVPSPFEDKPGLVIRDPFHFSEATLIVPPPLIECLEYFDGEHSALDLRAHLVRITGDLQAGDIETNLLNALSEAGFLEDENFEKRRAEPNVPSPKPLSVNPRTPAPATRMNRANCAPRSPNT